MAERDKLSGVLYAQSDLKKEDCQPEWNNLKKALKDDNIRNIAISAPYGAGKTSFLTSFFKKEFANKKSEANYQFINLPNFFLDSENKKNEAVELEKGIIGQIISPINPWKLPDSKIERLRTTSKKVTIPIYCCLALFFVGIIGIITNFKNFNFYSWLVVGLGFILFTFLYYFFEHKLNRLTWNASAEISGMKIGLNFADNKTNAYENQDLFLIYGDELRYALKVTKIRYLIFEDLDRFNNPLIFQKLRELNNNLNNGMDSNIVFLYSLRDSIFDKASEDEVENNFDENNFAKLRVKFFDYIITLPPLSNLNNSKQVFIKEIEKYPVLLDGNTRLIDEKYLNGIGMYVSDTREIIEIISETAVYKQKLGSEMDTNLVLGAIIYKNLYPNDYEKFLDNNSNLQILINNIDILLSKLYEDRNNEYSNYRKKIVEAYTNFQTEDNMTVEEVIGDLFEEYLDFDNSVILHGKTYKSSDELSKKKYFLDKIINTKKFDSEIDNLKQGNEKDSYQLKIINYILSNNFSQNTLFSEIINSLIDEIEEKHRDNLEKIKLISFGKLITIWINNAEFIDKFSENNNLVAALNFVKNSHALRYLLAEELITENISDYLSPSSNTLVYTDNKFIQNILERRAPKQNKHLVNAKKVESELNLKDILDENYKFAYSSDLVLLLIDDSIYKNKNKIISILKQSKRLSDLQLIYNVFLKVRKSYEEAWINLIITSWDSFFDVLFQQWQSNNIGSSEFILKNIIDFLVKSHEQYADDIFNNIAVNFENNMFKKCMAQLTLSEFQNLFKGEKREYNFADISFISRRLDLLKYVIKDKLYEKNKSNFEIMFNVYFEKSLQQLFYENIDNQFIEENLINIDIDKVSLNDISSLVDWVSEIKEDEIREQYELYALKVYNRVTDAVPIDERNSILKRLNFIKNIDALETELILNLVKNNKLIVNTEFVKPFNKKNGKLVFEYLLHFNDLNLIKSTFNNYSWEATMDLLDKSNYKAELVLLIDNYAENSDNHLFHQKDVNDESMKYLVTNTNSIKVIRNILDFKDLPLDIKNLVIKKIFTDKLFQGVFYKSTISKFYFNEENLIETWPMNSSNKIKSDISDLNAEIKSWCTLMRELGFTKRNSEYVFLKKMNRVFAN